ncbi:MAG: glycosyltransferase [bacterium]|nr:glycosyltransferase [bacterium]
MEANSLTIVHVDPETSFSGGEVQVFLLMEGLARRGHRNVLVCPAGSAAAGRAQERGIETRHVSMRNDLDLAAALRLKRVLNETAPDVVHLHTGRANWIGGLAARWANVPAVSTRRMDRVVKRNWRTRTIYGSLVQRVAAISPAVRGRLLDAGVPEDQTELIWSSVRPADLAPVRGRGAMRAELGAGARTCVLLGLGALVPRKGFDVLIEALARLDADEDCVAWIAGDGAERAALEALARERLPEGRVRLLGRRADVPDLLAACDLFVMPSRAEGLGVAALEAMAAGRAVVASGVGGLGEVVEDGSTGALVAPDDPGALAAALGGLINDGPRRDAYAAAGRARVDEVFLDERMVDAYERMYRHVRGQGEVA